MHKWNKLTASSAVLALILLLLSAAAADADSSVKPGTLRFEDQQNLSAVPADIEDTLEEEIARPGASEFVFAPLPVRSPSLGWTVGLPAMYIYKPDWSDEGDGPWTSGAVGFYSENESWGGGVFHRMSIRGDTWRITGAAFHADVNYDYFGIGGDPDTSVPLNQPTSIAMLEALYRVFPNFYVGLRGTYNDTEVRLDIPDGLLPPGTPLPDLSQQYKLMNLSPRFVYDSRDNQFYPTAGFYFNGTIDLSRESLGGDVDYEKYSLALNWYEQVTPSSVLAARLAIKHASGNAPFFVYPAFGSGGDLRGYQSGTYRDRFLVATQAELRYRFRPKLGVVGFAGVGSVASDFGGWDESLAAAGVGIRWVVAPENNMSLRIDVARGRDDTEFYIGLGEAF